jgi:hypothetical protein
VKLRHWTTLLLALWAAPLWADAALTPHTASYKVKISVLSGQLDTELKRTATGYQATHVIQPTGMSRMFARGTIKETSTFDTAPSGVKPREYTSQDSLSRDKENVRVLFNWNTGEARGTLNDEEIVSVIDGLAHDRVSIQYEVMLDLLNNHASDKYTMFEIDRLRPVNIEIVGEKNVDVPAGKFHVVGISHQAEGSKRVTTLWCAKELDYLPVIIEQHRKGKLKVRATLTSYHPTAAN